MADPGGRLRRAEDYVADHAQQIALLLVLAALTFTRRIPGLVILDVPPWIAITAFVVVIAVAFGLFSLQIYKVNILVEDWERICDDADRGARGADTVRELAIGLGELAAKVEALNARPPLPRPRPTPGPRTEPATAVLAAQADDWRTRFTFAEGGRR